VELSTAYRIFEWLLGWSLVLQTLEYLRIQRLDRVTDWQIQREEVPGSPPGIRALLDILLRPHCYTVVLVLRLCLALSLMITGLGLAGAGLLFAIALVLLIRWRGAFNGGSDFMTLVGISGLLLAQAVGAVINPESGWRTALWYVTVQTVSSYFVSGWVKLLRPEWRSGAALPVFLDSGVYGPLNTDSVYRWPRVAWLLSWAFTVWEGCFVLALLDIRWALVMCTTGILFHFMVFWHFGLNRFFWAWLASYPAVVYCAQWQISPV
jgi:hypothetical protein